MVSVARLGIERAVQHHVTDDLVVIAGRRSVLVTCGKLGDARLRALGDLHQRQAGRLQLLSHEIAGEDRVRILVFGRGVVERGLGSFRSPNRSRRRRPCIATPQAAELAAAHAAGAPRSNEIVAAGIEHEDRVRTRLLRDRAP